MGLYGFSIDVDGNAVQKVKETQDAVTGLGTKTKTELAHVEAEFDKLGQKAKQVHDVMANALAQTNLGAKTIQKVKETQDAVSGLRTKTKTELTQVEADFDKLAKKAKEIQDALAKALTVPESSNSTTKKIKDTKDAFNGLGKKAKDEIQDVEKEFQKLGEKASEIKRLLIEAFAIHEIYEFGKEIMEVTAEFEGFENRIKFASMSAEDFDKNMSYLNKTAKDLHLPKKELEEDFSEMQAGLVGTGVEGEKLRKLFTGISTAAATLHLPTYQLQRTLYDLKEIGEIGLNKRIERSLSTALPGIGAIVKQTFGKSMEELGKEHISGAAFLNKLAPALQERFGGGIENFGNSIQGRGNDLKNMMTDTMLEMGEELKPVFVNILSTAADALRIVTPMLKTVAEDVKGAFDSAPMIFFEHHLKSIIEFVINTGEVWLVYKGIMTGVNLVKSAGIMIDKSFIGAMRTENIAAKQLTLAEQELAISVRAYGEASIEAKIDTLALAKAQTEMTVASEASTVAVESFFAAMGGIGIMAFIGAIGMVITKLQDANSEIQESINKISHLDEMTQKNDEFQKRQSEINAGMGNWKNLTREQKVKLHDLVKYQVSDINNFDAMQGLSHVKTLRAEKDKYIAELEKRPMKLQQGAYGSPSTWVKDDPDNLGDKIAEATRQIASLESKYKGNETMMQGNAKLLNILRNYNDNDGKPHDYITPGGENEQSKGAKNISDLAGAKGGLGEAKVINIHIDTLQKNEVIGTDKLKSNAKEAIEILTRTLNNMAYSQGQ